MAEDFHAGICGENWWINSSRGVLTAAAGGPTPCTMVINDVNGNYGYSWSEIGGMKDIMSSSDDIHGSIVYQETPKSDQNSDSASGDDGSSSILIDSNFQTMGFNPSSSPTSYWNHNLLHGSTIEREVSGFDPMIGEEDHMGIKLNYDSCRLLQKDWSSIANGLKPIDSSPTTSYGYSSTLLQTMFDLDQPHQTHFNNGSIGEDSNDLSLNWSKFSTTKQSLTKQLQPSGTSSSTNGLHFTNNTPFWDASASTALNDHDISPVLLPSTRSQYSAPMNEEKPGSHNLVTKPNTCEDAIQDSASAAKKSNNKNNNGISSHQQVPKRPRIETPSSLPTFKVRKEKLGDRITALQQLVSPFGKTDTASVLHEAIEYIKYLHDQVNALNTPYMKSKDSIHQQGLSSNNVKNPDEQTDQDLRSRGLCLVPISSTFPIANYETSPREFWTTTF